MNESSLQAAERKLFFKRFLSNPRQLGTLAPITAGFARDAASVLKDPHNKIVVEVGAGTGRFTRALLNQGVQPENLYAVELDSELCDFLTKTLPGVNVIHGDAAKLVDLLPKELMGQVDVVFSVIPFMYLPEEVREEITKACFSVMKQGSMFYQVTYSFISPLKKSDFVKGKITKQKWLNVPPGFVWRYEKINNDGARS